VFTHDYNIWDHLFFLEDWVGEPNTNLEEQLPIEEVRKIRFCIEVPNMYKYSMQGNVWHSQIGKFRHFCQAQGDRINRRGRETRFGDGGKSLFVGILSKTFYVCRRPPIIRVGLTIH